MNQAITLEEVKELVKVVNETGIAELLLQRGEHSIKITRAVTPAQERVVSAVVPVAVSAAPTAISAVPSMPPSEPAAIAPAPFAPSLPDIAEQDVIVKSPIVGTYYDAPAPDAPKFVKVGDAVEPKQILCIIESMKLMNEIEAETSGIVISKHIENGRPVEYGESLFAIRPSR